MASRVAPSLPSPFVGRVLGGFRIAQPIATGGMATVFLGRKTGPGRYAQTAAIKVLHPHLAQNCDLTEMFLDEARLASCVNHPNVCRVLDFGEAEGTFYLAMEYVRGESFADVLAAFDEHKVTYAERKVLSAYVLAQACEALHAIHEAVDSEGRPLRVVHRDVSPQNLLVAYDGSIRLLDFGIASAEGRAHTGGADSVRGRYAYMAPEQMRGLPLDRRADVWSLGVILREAVTGQNPYLRETQSATMLAVTRELLPSWPLGTEPRLRAIGEVALARAPQERFASARALGDALTRYLSQRGESALSAELAQLMSTMFATQIAEKRAALRTLAGDDTFTDAFAADYASARVSIAPGADGAPPPAPDANAAARHRPRAPLLAAAALLFGLSATGSWYATRREAEAPPVLALAARPKPPAAHGTGNAQPDVGVTAALSAKIRRASPAITESPLADTTEPSAPRLSNSEAGGPKVRKGTVVIGTSQGWATVFDGGRKLGTTPLHARLLPGAHTLIIRPYGAGAARQKSIEVAPGKTIKLRVDL